MIETLRFVPPNDIITPQATSLEARHLASTYALHRIASHRNLKPMLPPDHRDIWVKLDDLKKEHLASSAALTKSTGSNKSGDKSQQINAKGILEDKTYLYAQDPFLADRERKANIEKLKQHQSSDEHKKKMEMKKIMNSVKTALSTEQSSNNSPSGSGTSTPDINKIKSIQDTSESVDTSHESSMTSMEPKKKRPRFDKWLYMSKEARVQAEYIIKKFHGFASSSVSIDNKTYWDNPNNSAVYKAVTSALVQIGFPQYQAEEALEHCTSLAEAIEWLLIHVPEDDLPPMFASTTENMDKRSTTTIVNTDLKFQYSLRDIRAHGGYSEDLIIEELQKVQGDKRKAIVQLTKKLALPESDMNSIVKIDEADTIETWKEEMFSLASIYTEEEFVENTEQLSCTFKFEIPVKFKPEYFDDLLPEMKNKRKKKSDNTMVNYKVELTLWMPSLYPNEIPGITINVIPSFDEANNFLRKFNLLDLIKRTGDYAYKNTLGEFMVLSIVEWFKDNFAEILLNPSKLVQLAQGITGVQENEIKLEKSKNLKKHKGSTELTPDKASLDVISSTLQQHSEKLHSLSKFPNLNEMIKSREQLPAWKKKEEIINIINKHQVVLITGETGSGKSTQVAQFILDAVAEKIKESTLKSPLNIICTQPRRISAMGLAQRVADERDSPVGEQVGYVIRGESKTSSKTLLRFVTTGVLLRMIQSSGSSLQPLQNISHIIVDEVHERSLDSDFLLILLKRIISARKDLKIILMSATVDPQLFINYFGGKNKVGYTHIEGRTFPVQDYYLDKILEITDFTPPGLIFKSGKKKFQNDEYYDDYDDDDNSGIVTSTTVSQKIIAMAKQGIQYDLIATLVSYIDRQLGEKDGSILVFMPGTAEITRCINTISSSSSRFYALPLHASLAPAEQRKVFPKPPKGFRKVVVSTNVAETSITIPDIVAVIDTGRVKETKYDVVSNVMRLVDSWTSKAAATQRRGRAGRVRQGDCYKLFTKSVEERDMPDRPLPEILRVPLEQLYLNVKAMGVNHTSKFLNEALDPPHFVAIDRARNTLIQLGALEIINKNSGEESLTPLGNHMSMIPADLKCAKLLVLSAMFGCINTGLIVASIMSLRSPFISVNVEKRDELRNVIVKFSGPGATRKTGGVGDLLTQAKAYYDWEQMRQDPHVSPSQLRKWCKENFLSYQGLQDIFSAKKQFISSLQEIGFIPAGSLQKIPEYYTINDDLRTLQQTGLTRAVIGASMGPTHLANVTLPEKVFKTVGGAGAIEMDNTEAKDIRFFGPNIVDEEFAAEKSNTKNHNNTSQPQYLTERLFIHPVSCIFETTKFLDDTLTVNGHGIGYGDGAFISFARKMHTSKLFIDSITPLSTYGLLFFSENVKVDTFGNGVIVSTGGSKLSDSIQNDEENGVSWLGLRCWPRIGILVKLLRHLFNDLVKQKLNNPGLDLSKNEIMIFIQKLIENNGAVRK